MAKPTHEHSQALALYEALASGEPNIEIKGATVPYTSLNGHMSSYLTKAGQLALRLPDGPREQFLKRYKASLCQAYGVVQREYVEVPDAVLKKTSELKPYFTISVEYVRSLKPKPTTKKTTKTTTKKK